MMVQFVQFVQFSLHHLHPIPVVQSLDAFRDPVTQHQRDVPSGSTTSSQRIARKDLQGSPLDTTGYHLQRG